MKLALGSICAVVLCCFSVMGVGCSLICTVLCFFFFFQAEDGIRDLYVTGVQTCALPIYRPTRGETDTTRLPMCSAREHPGRRQRSHAWRSDMQESLPNSRLYRRACASE